MSKLVKARLGKHQKFSLDYVCKQVFVYVHGNSYIETSKGWGKPHEGRVIASLIEKGLINCWADSLYEVKLTSKNIPNEGSFFAMPTKLGRWYWKNKMIDWKNQMIEVNQ